MLAAALGAILAHAGASPAAGAAESGGRTFTDAAGRRVVVPSRVNRVFAAGPPASIILYTLAPEKLLGWNRAPRAAERAFIAPAYRDLPELGRLTGRGDTANVEVVLEARPDVVVDYGSTGETYRSLAERVQARTGIPYLLLDGRFRESARAYRLLGELLGVEERAETLARYAEETFARVDALQARLAPAERPRVYYGRGPDGLETGLRGSINVEILELVGAVNVAAGPGREGGLARVSMEDVLRWDPEVVLTLNPDFYRHALQSPLWSSVEAVREQRVYKAPQRPFGWFDRPPSVNRLIGVHWLFAVLYPELASVDLRATTRRFYRLFYHVELGEGQLDDLLEGATSGRP